MIQLCFIYGMLAMCCIKVFNKSVPSDLFSVHYSPYQITLYCNIHSFFSVYIAAVMALVPASKTLINSYPIIVITMLNLNDFSQSAMLSKNINILHKVTRKKAVRKNVK